MKGAITIAKVNTALGCDKATPIIVKTNRHESRNLVDKGVAEEKITSAIEIARGSMANDRRFEYKGPKVMNLQGNAAKNNEKNELTIKRRLFSLKI
jgi:hypothetical protein